MFVSTSLYNAVKNSIICHENDKSSALNKNKIDSIINLTASGGVAYWLAEQSRKETARCSVFFLPFDCYLLHVPKDQGRNSTGLANMGLNIR